VELYAALGEQLIRCQDLGGMIVAPGLRPSGRSGAASTPRFANASVASRHEPELDEVFGVGASR